MDDDDFFEDEDFTEEDLEEEEGEDDDGFTDREDRPKKRIPLNLNFFPTRQEKKAKKTYVPREEENEADEEDVDDGYEEVEEKKSTFSARSTRNNTANRFGRERITPMKNRSSSQTFSSEVRVLHPKNMEQASDIGAALLDEAVVVLNLEALDLDVAQRIVDFASGCVYALGADLHKVTEYFFVIAPSSVEITGDMKNIMSGESFAVRAEY